MNCHEARLSLSELLDGELADDRRTALEYHLELCAECREQLAEIQDVDRLLESVYRKKVEVPDVLIEHVLRELPPPAVSLSVLPEPQRNYRPMSVRFVGIYAIVILVVVIVVMSRSADRSHDLQAGRIEVAAGNVVLGTADSDVWVLTASQQTQLRSGTRLATAEDGRCQLRIGKDTLVRVDANTEVIVIADNHIELLKGRVYCRAKSSEMRISLPNPELSARRATEVRCPEQTELQCNAFPGLFTCQLADEVEPESLLWQLPLLGSSLVEQEEIRQIVESGLAHLGETKASYANEALVHSFGEQGSIPLLAYVQSHESRQKPEIRVRALRLAATIVTRRQLGDLRRLARDSDAEISRMAASLVEQLESGAH